MRKISLPLSVALILAVLLSACGTPSSTPTTQEPKPEAPVTTAETNITETEVPIPEVESTEPPAERVTIQYYDWQLSEDPAGNIVRRQLARFQELYPNVVIEQQSVPTAQRGDKLMTMILGGATPDVVHVNETDMARVVPTGALEPMTTCLETDPDLETALIPAMVNMVTYDGTVYGIPRFSSINTLIYNAKHFREAGLDPDNPPKTWDEFADYAKKLTRDTNSDGEVDRWGVGLLGAKTGSFGFRYWWALWGAGGEILTEDNSKSLLDSPESVEALTFYTDLYLEHEVVPPGITDVDYTVLVNDFIAEKTSMIVDGPWQVGRITQENPNIEMRAAPMPAKDGQQSATTGGGGFLAISSTSEHKDIACDLIRFLSSPENHWEYVNEGSFLPVRTDTAEKVKSEGNPLMGEFADTLAYAKLTPLIPEMPEIALLLVEEAQFVLIGEKTPDEAALSLSNRVDELLSQ